MREEYRVMVGIEGRDMYLRGTYKTLDAAKEAADLEVYREKKDTNSWSIRKGQSLIYEIDKYLIMNSGFEEFVDAVAGDVIFSK